MQCRRRKLLALRNLGIRIGFEEIRSAVGREAKIDAGIAVELERAIDPFGRVLDPRAQFRRKILGRGMQDAAALLVVGVVLDLLRGNVPRALRCR